MTSSCSSTSSPLTLVKKNPERCCELLGFLFSAPWNSTFSNTVFYLSFILLRNMTPFFFLRFHSCLNISHQVLIFLRGSSSWNKCLIFQSLWSSDLLLYWISFFFRVLNTAFSTLVLKGKCLLLVVLMVQTLTLSLFHDTLTLSF